MIYRLVVAGNVNVAPLLHTDTTHA